MDEREWILSVLDSDEVQLYTSLMQNPAAHGTAAPYLLFKKIAVLRSAISDAVTTVLTDLRVCGSCHHVRVAHSMRHGVQFACTHCTCKNFEPTAEIELDLAGIAIQKLKDILNGT